MPIKKFFELAAEFEFHFKGSRTPENVGKLNEIALGIKKIRPSALERANALKKLLKRPSPISPEHLEELGKFKKAEEILERLSKENKSLRNGFLH